MKTTEKLNRVYELMEQYRFDELSDKHKEMVLECFTETDYNEQRETIVRVANLFSEANHYEPKPFPIVNEKKRFLMAPIPLYQALAGIAAMALLMLLVLPTKKMVVEKQVVKYITLRDTVEKEVVAYDTIEKIVERPVYKEKLVYVNTNSIDQQPGPPRLLNVPESTQHVNFSQSIISNKGFSMKDDTLLFTLPKVY